MWKLVERVSGHSVPNTALGVALLCRLGVRRKFYCGVSQIKRWGRLEVLMVHLDDFDAKSFIFRRYTQLALYEIQKNLV